MHHEIRGEFAQYAKLTLERGETCWAGKGAIMSHVDDIEWKLRVPGGMAGAARRMLSGQEVVTKAG
jgi:uncharacterized protein (AIM24 family)